MNPSSLPASIFFFFVYVQGEVNGGASNLLLIKFFVVADLMISDFFLAERKASFLFWLERGQSNDDSESI